jgi:hypothetical protein
MIDHLAINCWCWHCNRDRTVNGIPYSMTRMILCPDCGNKRCPRATDHREACTGSNDAGQLGSRYGVWPDPNRPLFDFVEGKKPDEQ